MKRGFTLIEIIVTMALLTTALVGPVALVTRGLFDFSFVKNKLVALHLAQEGLELARAIRENNVLCDAQNGTAAKSWDEHPSGGTLNGTYELAADQTMSLDCKPPGGGPSILFSFPNPTMIAAATDVNCTSPNKLRIDANSFYQYTAGLDTVFSRCIVICSPPQNCSGGTTNDGDIPASDQIEIISKVDWIERGASRSAVLRERLYNWR